MSNITNDDDFRPIAGLGQIAEDYDVNSPRPSAAIPAQFDAIRMPSDLYDAICTSGDATIDELSRRAPGPVFKLGPDRDDTLYAGLELHFADIDEAEFISCTGLFNDDTETPDDYTDFTVCRAPGWKSIWVMSRRMTVFWRLAIIFIRTCLALRTKALTACLSVTVWTPGTASRFST